MSSEKKPMSGAKGFTIVVGAMFGVIIALWVIGYFLSPHGLAPQR
ncbi:MAG: hypothetical protein JWN52_2954 [Actinomycetia bacterium]|jgi:hypothetical protein|nr:hypothetical protein [Actinomycetes bacterium]